MEFLSANFSLLFRDRFSNLYGLNFTARNIQNIALNGIERPSLCILFLGSRVTKSVPTLGPGHDRAVASVVVDLAHTSDGGMFVLFTSHAALRRTAKLVRARRLYRS